MSTDNLRVLIVAEHASLQYGGEAALPLHYFRVLRQRGIEAWLIVHERTRAELLSYFSADCDRIYFVKDSFGHKILWHLGKPLPHRLSLFTFGFLLRLLTQYIQRQVIRRLVRQKGITLVHQPIPVSPKEPSLIYDVGVPVVIGPMNGGMHYPPGFQNLEHPLEQVMLALGQLLANGFNRLIPGKLKAKALLVANKRTQAALPNGISGIVRHLPENGVNLSVFQQSSVSPNLAGWTDHSHTHPNSQPITRFIYVGRLVDWKAVDLLLLALRRVAQKVPVVLDVIGDGPERHALEAEAQQLGFAIHNELSSSELSSYHPATSPDCPAITFSGWLSQENCADRLRCADVMVLPSLMECGGAVVLEAMAVGIPVIATNWGGVTDYLTEESGILVTPKSREQFITDLATAMERLALDPSLRHKMGKAGQQRVIQHFDWEAKINDIIDIYNEVLKDGAESLARDSEPPTIPSKHPARLYSRSETLFHRSL